MNTTLEDLGADGFIVETLAITLPGNGDNTISYLTVPEPNTSLLMILSLFGLSLRKRRQ